jgi:hypothetical protein
MNTITFEKKALLEKSTFQPLLNVKVFGLWCAMMGICLDIIPTRTIPTDPHPPTSFQNGWREQRKRLKFAS